MPTSKKEKAIAVPVEQIEQAILLIRGQKVILDANLAELYGVPTKALKQAARKNMDRFPEYSMFHLTRQEIRHISQITKEPDFGVTNVNYDLTDVLVRAEVPQ